IGSTVPELEQLGEEFDIGQSSRTQLEVVVGVLSRGDAFGFDAGLDVSDLPGDLGVEVGLPHHRVDDLLELGEDRRVTGNATGPDQGEDLPWLGPFGVVATEPVDRSGQGTTTSFGSELGVELVAVAVATRLGEHLAQIGCEPGTMLP